MGDFFANLRSGVQFPQVVMNQGPMPGTGGLPRPLHDSVDGRINYNSSLLGDLTPYAYGEPGYLSSQTAYLNIPHKIQKLVPPVFLPEAKLEAKDFFDLSHPVDDGDLAFTLRLDRNSIFCTGLRTGGSRRSTTGTAIDPLVNLATVNYILAGVQQLGGMTDPSKSLWFELASNMGAARNAAIDDVSGVRKRTALDLVVDLVRHCIRPFGIARGSERQGGQNEATPSPATWPVSFVTSVTLDGKESNVMNMWHHVGISAGEDLVLRLKLMPLCPYTLNHYYKGVKRQSWGFTDKYVWQLVPDKFHLEPPGEEERKHNKRAFDSFTDAGMKDSMTHRIKRGKPIQVTPDTPWQELGYWHIGRTQIMSGKYGVEEYWHNDLANGLRTNHLDMTLQPMFSAVPLSWKPSVPAAAAASPDRRPERRPRTTAAEWEPKLALERLPCRPPPARRVENLERRPRRPESPPARRVENLERRPRRPDSPPARRVENLERRPRRPDSPPARRVEEPRWDEELALPVAPPPAPPPPPAEEDLGLDLLSGPGPLSEPRAPPVAKRGGRGKKGGAAVGGTLLRPDGSSEASMVGLL
jgi:hypothetical protein